MRPEEYNEFTAKLQQNLESDPRVVGLVALGSMAQQDYLPDQWSDHDFFVVVGSGSQSDFRTNLNWLPAFEKIAFYFQETSHGMKVVYASGHLLEFAVFDLQEVFLARVNRFKVLLDRGKVEESLRELAQTSAHEASLAKSNDATLFGQFLTNLLVGVGRYQRGEKLNGQQFVKSYALRHLLILLAKYLPSENKGILDNLEPYRRFERAYPELGAELAIIMSKELPTAALDLLELAERELKPYLQVFSKKAIEVIRGQLTIGSQA